MQIEEETIVLFRGFLKNELRENNSCGLVNAIKTLESMASSRSIECLFELALIVIKTPLWGISRPQFLQMSLYLRSMLNV